MSSGIKLTIEEMCSIAESRGGKCLSLEYVNSGSQLIWECHRNHTWKTSAESIKSGRWCPYCNKSISEEICRVYFETLFNEKFIRVRPKWLLGSKGCPLELDGYCGALNMAFEHNGPQHYSVSNYRYSEKIVENDLIKISVLNKMNIKIIIIPDLFSSVKLKNLRSFIKNECIKLGIGIPLDFDSKPININSIYCVDMMKKYQDIAKSKNGFLIEQTYINSATVAQWRCANNHYWYTTPNSIACGTWCHECLKWSINDAKDVAIKRNGECLSGHYINNKLPLDWKCNKCKTIWKANFHNILLGKWCPTCARLPKISIDDIKKIAISKNGICLSDEYLHRDIKLTWQCNECSFIWNTTVPSIISAGSWCPKCAVARRTKKDK